MPAASPLYKRDALFKKLINMLFVTTTLVSNSSLLDQLSFLLFEVVSGLFRNPL